MKEAAPHTSKAAVAGVKCNPFLSPEGVQTVAAAQQFQRGWKSSLPIGKFTRRSLRKFAMKHHGFTPAEADQLADKILGKVKP